MDSNYRDQKEKLKNDLINFIQFKKTSTSSRNVYKSSEIKNINGIDMLVWQAI